MHRNRRVPPVLLAALLSLMLIGPAVGQEGASSHPPQAVELYNEGLELAQASKFAEAKTKFEEALAIAADFTEARYNLGLILRQLGDNEGAAANLAKSVDGAPQPAVACKILGQTLAELGRTDEAIQSYRDAMTRDEKQKELHYAIAELVARSAKTEEQRAQTIAAYEAALKAAPRDPAARKAYRSLGKLYYKAAQHDKALDAYVKAAKLDPGNAELHYNCGILYNRLKKSNDAVASLKKAIELKNPNGKAYYALAGIYYNALRMDEKAAHAYEQAAADPNFNKTKDASDRAAAIRTYIEQKEAAAESGEGEETN